MKALQATGSLSWHASQAGCETTAIAKSAFIPSHLHLSVNKNSVMRVFDSLPCIANPGKIFTNLC